MGMKIWKDSFMDVSVVYHFLSVVVSVIRVVFQRKRCYNSVVEHRNTLPYIMKVQGVM